MTSFHFEQHFLMPFFEIFSNQNNIFIRELILECSIKIINELHNVLHSGWIVIFQILVSASNDSNFYQKSFLLTEKIIIEYFEDCKNYILHFIPVLSSIIIKDIGNSFAFSTIPFFTIISEKFSKDQIDNWIGIFEGLISCNQHKDLDIKQLVNESLLEICLKYGCNLNLFNDQLWNYLFNKIFLSLIEINEENISLQSSLLRNLFDQIIFDDKFLKIINNFLINIFNFLINLLNLNIIELNGIIIQKLSFLLNKLNISLNIEQKNLLNKILNFNKDLLNDKSLINEFNNLNNFI